MNVSKENIDELNAVLTIELEKADYEPKVEKGIKDYGKRVAIKGFRPGHAPAGMIKKMYGKSILVETIDRMIGEELSKYIKDNNLDILGEPLPNEKQEPIDFDKDVDKITFKFDLGLSPEVNVAIDNTLNIPSYSISVDDKAIDEQIENIAGRYGSHVPVEVSTENSLLKGVVTLGETKNEKALVSVAVIKDEAEKAKFIGKKAGDTVEFNIRKAFPEDTEISYILGTTKEEAANVAADAVAAIAISEVSEFKNAEVNKELFDKVFPDGSVADINAFREKIKEQLITSNAFVEEYRFGIDTRKAIIAAAGDIKLPEEFLKRWLTVVNRDNKNFSAEVLEQEFPKFLNDLKWQVVKNRVAKKNDLKIDHDDVLNFAKKTGKAQLMQYGITNYPEEQLTTYAENMVKNEEQRQHLVEGAVEEKVFAFAKEHANIESKAISQDDFNKLFEAEK
ncbi:MAG: trigger factor [Marinilabiliaceae bacterium]